MEITIQDAIRKAVEIRGLEILKDKKRFLILLEDLAPILSEERDFLEKAYQNEVGKLLYEACLAEDAQRREYLADADAYLEEQYGFHQKWRERLLSYFREIRIHRAIFRVLSQGEEKRTLMVCAPDTLTGEQVSCHLPPGPLLRLLYSEQRQKLGIRNLSAGPFTIIGADASRWECPPGRVQALEHDMRICILPRIAQLNVIGLQ